MQYSFYTADIFTSQVFGGNPLAVFPNAEGLTIELMQKIAAEINYSETVFVFPPTTPQGTRRLRIFTPKAEIPFAGHPTVGTAFVLTVIQEIPIIAEEMILNLEEEVGVIPVKVKSKSGKPIYSEMDVSQAPQFGPEPPDVELLAKILSLQPEQILTDDYSSQAVSCGLPFLLIPLRDRQALSQAQLQLSLWQEHLSQFWASCVYLFCWESSPTNIDLHARMFAPSLGINEDPATGSATAALGGYFAQKDRKDTLQTWRIEQGRDMGRPSQLILKIDATLKNKTTISVGGASVLVSQGTMQIPN